ncbi:hypothetical protein P692DRAFT_201057375 [Suillus brevipes Sb2]|nr:hypothetical protein P692DRAFT_201057375 [Suillus brevipes Sb2]
MMRTYRSTRYDSCTCLSYTPDCRALGSGILLRRIRDYILNRSLDLVRDRNTLRDANSLTDLISISFQHEGFAHFQPSWNHWVMYFPFNAHNFIFPLGHCAYDDIIAILSQSGCHETIDKQNPVYMQYVSIYTFIYRSIEFRSHVLLDILCNVLDPFTHSA